ncbi:Putative dolichyldiphosphatase [Psilocybe cubensis]|uniref:Dolichyldiphosphatase n=1 Tax=Psilocybe cubensis TaxID=181762 RepID=A0ACB8GUN7_PSICU|nr:Putative dolichyldiphosphatase [Psilocybe cubensis]KAH9479346.1 Putative dolichyldiphosphatase [Psilocybe cubensis]
MRDGPRTSLDLTHVLYDDSSYFSLALALVTLSPILLMASYAALAVQTREFIIIVMWAGQFAGELLNWIIKRIIKQERPIESIGNGYGFPSSHSQYMAYFASFLIAHLYSRHRFSSTGSKIVDFIWRMVVYAALLGWAGLVAYSRYYLGYHSAHQIIWGLAIGFVLGSTVYILSEAIPTRYPNSWLGRLKASILDNPIVVWLQIRDGWAIWADGGREGEWVRWRREWEAQKKTSKPKSR